MLNKKLIELINMVNS